MSDQEHLIDQFVSVTNASKYLAEQYLQRNKGDLMNAIEDYYANKPLPTAPTASSLKPTAKK
ncbi:uncharacterized protein PRCAT00003223001 [Priceomyces carsonii]|uniref:uncharacterized protein n=1 Tax=Priceomyces carsonii TaxID=28549 RepID=UPI002ED85AC9|nr:unnamed protein product [Priceomyces carsonii]